MTANQDAAAAGDGERTWRKLTLRDGFDPGSLKYRVAVDIEPDLPFVFADSEAAIDCILADHRRAALVTALVKALDSHLSTACNPKENLPNSYCGAHQQMFEYCESDRALIDAASKE